MSSSTGGESSGSGDVSGGWSSTGSSGDSESTGASTGPAVVCGDGVVEGDEECDDANDVSDDRCATNCTKNRWVFATAALYDTGDLNGIEGADSYCRQHALQSGRADDSWTTFIAWLSDSNNDVRDRLYRGRGAYVRTDGIPVVLDVEQFFSGMIEAPINVDENGEVIAGGAITGTRPDGTRTPGTHCQDWKAGELLDFTAYTGGTEQIDANWTMDQTINPNPCIGLAAHLYCIEGK